MERKKEREKKGGRKSGLRSEQGDVLRAFYILYMLSSCPIVAPTTRDGPIFFALIRSPAETTDNRVTHASVRNKLKSRITAK